MMSLFGLDRLDQTYIISIYKLTKVPDLFPTKPLLDKSLYTMTTLLGNVLIENKSYTSLPHGKPWSLMRGLRISLSNKVPDLDHELWPNELCKMMVSVTGVKEVMERIWLSGKVPDLDHELWPNGPWKVMVSITGVKNLTQSIWLSGKKSQIWVTNWPQWTMESHGQS